MKKYELIARRVDGRAHAKIEENERGAFYKVKDVDAKIAQLEAAYKEAKEFARVVWSRIR